LFGLFSLLWFDISHGKTKNDFVVIEIEFEGNQTFKSGKLKKQILTKTAPWYFSLLFWKSHPTLNESVLQTDLLRLKKFYESEGFLQNKIRTYSLDPDSVQKTVGVKIFIDEGAATIIDSVFVIFQDSSLTPEEKVKIKKEIKVKPGQRFARKILDQEKKALFTAIGELSYPYAKITTKTSIQPNQQTARIRYLINSGPMCKYGPITIEGNKSVSKNIIRRELGFKKEDDFKFSEVTAAQNRIYKLQLFQYVSIVPNWESNDAADRLSEIPIHIRVKESRAIASRFGVGYGSEEKYRAMLELTHRNFLGDARSLNLQTKISGLGFDGTLTLIQPYLFFTKLNLTQKFFYKFEKEKLYELRRGGSETALNHEITQFFSASYSYLYEKDRIKLKGTNIDLTQIKNLKETETEILSRKQYYNKSLTIYALQFDNTDIPLAPTRGTNFRLRFEDSGTLIPSEFKYLKAQLDLRKYFHLNKWMTFATRSNWGFIHPFKTSEYIPLEERFYTGGSNSVRGWGRRMLGPISESGSPLGGNSTFEGNLELRTKLNTWLELVYFYDCGNVWPDKSDLTLTDLKSAIGTGIRWYTPIGPVRLDVALKNAPYPGQNRWQFHISIGQAF